MGEIQRADPATRRRALIAIAVIAVAGWGAWFGLERWLAGLRGVDPARQQDALESALVWATWGAMLPVAAFASYMWRYGTRVLRAGRFPAPGAKVIRDTLVLHGDPARVRGTALRVLAALLGLLAAGTLIAVYRLLERLHP
ncbi:MAG TPA: hypothetical protein VFU77_00860 [Steroidobacteraceae bacterium]|nr:hypothetical protein [Steroidobacteraceae bacterium]